MDKKGYVRTLEAIIAIVLIFIFILSILPKKESPKIIPDDIDFTAKQILNEIQNDPGLRGDIILSTTSCINYCKIKNFIKDNIPLVMGFELVICDDKSCYSCPGIDLECYKNEIPEIKDSTEIIKDNSLNVYTKNLIIEDNQEEKIVKLFLWKKV